VLFHTIKTYYHILKFKLEKVLFSCTLLLNQKEINLLIKHHIPIFYYIAKHLYLLYIDDIWYNKIIKNL